MVSLGVAVTLYLIITQSAARTIILKLGKPLPAQPRYMQDEVPRMMFKTFKSAIVRVIKFYRSMKPEVKLATCFSRYAGIVGRSYQCASCERALKKRQTKDEEVTVQQFMRNVVHTMMLFMTDLMPQPVSAMMRTAMKVWAMTRSMYKAVQQDEMGNCSLDYMSKRFWWWLGI